MASFRQLAAAALVLCASAHGAEPLSVKGIQLGMSKDQVTAIIRAENQAGGFTIGGAKSASQYAKGLTTIDQYRDGGLDMLAIFFRPHEFDSVEAAVRTKYSDLACDDMPVQSGAGVALTQRVCVLSDDQGGRITIHKYASKVTSSALVFSSKAYSEEFKNAREKSKANF